jgi:hypothetical protein
MFLRKLLISTVLILVAVLGVSMVMVRANRALAQNGDNFTTDFRLEACKFKSEGENPYFILKPRYQLLFEGEEDGEAVRLLITVLNDTEELDFAGVGKIKTRVVQEQEWVADELVEVSRNFFAQCEQTNAVYYFGEDVDIYEDGEIVNHEGAWRAGENGAMPGLIMPGTFLLGSRYFQEQAADVAMDQAEHIGMGLQVNVPAGTFEDCVEVLETTPLEPGSESTKRYCPGVGLVFDNGVELVQSGFNISTPDDDEGDDDNDS